MHISRSAVAVDVFRSDQCYAGGSDNTVIFTAACWWTSQLSASVPAAPSCRRTASCTVLRAHMSASSYLSTAISTASDVTACDSIIYFSLVSGAGALLLWALSLADTGYTADIIIFIDNFDVFCTLLRL